MSLVGHTNSKNKQKIVYLKNTDIDDIQVQEMGPYPSPHLIYANCLPVTSQPILFFKQTKPSYEALKTKKIFL